jgi:putative transposase
MPYRFIPFTNGQIYHIYNRGTEKRHIFESGRDRSRFIKTLQYYQLEGPKPRFSIYKPSHSIETEQIVEILCYCLMPNHFHLLIRQVRDGGITEFMSKVSNSYTKYFNTKYKRIGPLFQGEFKTVLVESNEQLLHLSRYIHLNPLASFLVKDLEHYRWSSYQEYIDNFRGICAKTDILNFFKTASSYQKFVLDRADYSQSLEIIKHQLIEDF